MIKVGDKVKVKSSGAVGVVQEVLTEEEVCVEFDKCAGSRTSFHHGQLDLIGPFDYVAANLDVTQGDKGL